MQNHFDERRRQEPARERERERKIEHKRRSEFVCFCMKEKQQRKLGNFYRSR